MRRCARGARGCSMKDFVIRWLGVVSVCALIAPSATDAAQQDIYWTNTSSGVFSDAANWRGGVPPDASDKAMFTNGGTFTVNLSGNQTNRGVIFDAESADITVNLGGFFWLAATNTINQFQVGMSTGRDNRVLVTNGILRTTRLRVGENGRGVLDLVGGVRVEVTNAAGLQVGLGTGTGILTIADADTILNTTSNGTHRAGSDVGSFGHIIVSNGLFAVTGGLYVGDSGVGALTVVRGTNFYTGTVRAGNESGAEGTITLAEPGANVNASLWLGNAAGSLGQLVLSNGTFYGQGEMQFGVSGTAFAVLSGGSLVVTNGTTHLTIPFRSGTGTVVMSSPQSTLTVTGSLPTIRLANDRGRGTLIVSNGMVDVWQLNVGYSGLGGVGEFFLYNATNYLSDNAGRAMSVGFSSGTTGLVVLADDRALLLAQRGGTGGGILLGDDGDGTLIVSNGTIYTKGLFVGNDVGSRGTFILQDGRVYVQSNTFSVGNNDGCVGWASIDHPNAVLDNEQGASEALVGDGDVEGGEGDLYISNGLAKFYNLSIAQAGRGYVEVGAATVTVANDFRIPRNQSTSDGTGLFAMVSADAYVVATNAIYIGQDGNNDTARKASCRFLVSNGTLRVGQVQVGRHSDGYFYVGAATVTVEKVGDSGFALGAGANTGQGTGTVVLAHPGSLLDSPAANFQMGTAQDATTLLQLSNGVMNVAKFRMGAAVQTWNYVSIGDGTINSTGDWQLAYTANTTNLVTLDHPNAQVISTNSVLDMGYRSNSISRITLSNGSLLFPSAEMGAEIAAAGRPSANSELLIHAATVTLTRAGSTAVALMMGDIVGNTGMIVLAHAAALLDVTNGSRTYVGNSGAGLVVISNGLVRAAEMRLGNSSGGVGEVRIGNGTLQLSNRLAIGMSGNGIVNLDHANALIDIGTNTLSLAEIASSGHSSVAALNLSNGTVRSAAQGVTNFVGSITQNGGSLYSAINVKNGTLDLEDSFLFVGNRNGARGELNISGGTVLVSRITLLGVAGATATLSTGTVAMSAGHLYLGGLNSLGSTPGGQSNVWLSGGTLHNLASFTTPLTITLTNLPGAGLVTFDICTNIVEISGKLTGPGHLRKIGCSKLVLHSANTHGGTEVSGGAVVAQYRAGSATSTGRVDVLSGGLLLGTGAVARFNLGGGLVSPGNETNQVGNLLAGTMNWTNGSYRWEVQNFIGNNWDTLAGTGVLSIASGIVTIQVVSLQGNGSLGPADNYDPSAGYTCVIASATSFSGFDEAKFRVDLDGFVNDEGAAWSITTSGTNLQLVIAPSPSSSRAVYWDGDATAGGVQAKSGSWRVDSNAWLVGGTGSDVTWDNDARDKAIFRAAPQGVYTVSVDMAVATNSGISMDSPSNYTYVLKGTGTLALVSQAQAFTIQQPASALVIAAPINVISGAVTKAGGGALFLESNDVQSEDGTLVRTGKLYIGRGGTNGVLPGGPVVLLDGGAELHFNRSSYTITNPIAGGRTFITNTGGGYVWRAGATADFLKVQGGAVVTQASGTIVYTNYVRVEPIGSTARPILTIEGGVFNTPKLEIGETGAGTATVVVAGGTLQCKTNSVGGGSNNDKGANLLLQSGSMVCENLLDLGKSGGSQTNLLLQTGGDGFISGGKFIVRSNGIWRQTGGTFSVTPPALDNVGMTMHGKMSIEGGSFQIGGSYINLGQTTRTRFGEIPQLLITNDASFVLAELNTNVSRATYLAVGAATEATGRVLVAGGSLIMTNSLGAYSIGGTVRSNSGDIVLGWSTGSHGILDIQGGTVRVYQVWMGGHHFGSALGSAFNAINPVPGSLRAEVYMSGGALYTMRGISNWHVAGASTYTNVALSGGTLGALGDWVTLQTISLSNAPGPGLTRFDPAGNRMTLAGALRGEGSLSMDGAGTLVISNNNGALLSAAHFVSNGVLEVGNSAGTALGSGLLTVSGGGILAGTGAVNQVTFRSGGLVSPGALTNVGTLTAGNTVWSNTSYRFEILDFSGAYGTGWDRFSSTGSLTIASGSAVTVTVASINAAGVVGAALNYNPTVTYTVLLASANSISGFDVGAFTLDTTEFLNDEITASIQLVGATNIALIVAPGVAGDNRLLYWDADKNAAGVQNGTGTWSAALANWQTIGGANLAWNNGRKDHAVFDGAAGAGSWTVTVQGIAAATNIGFTFLNNGGTYTVAGTGLLVLAGSPSIVTANAPGTISARLQGGALTKVGASTLTLGGSNDYTGALTVSNGAVRLTHAYALGSTNGATVVASGAELVAAASGSPTLRDPLTISGTGTNGLGALRFTTSSAGWVGTVTVVGATTRIGVDAGLNATLYTVVTGGVADVFVGGAGRLVVNAGVQLGSGKIVKDGTGALSLRGASAYNGGTIVSAGTLRVCGSCAANVAGTATIRLENNTVLASESSASTIVNPLSLWGNVQLVDSYPYDKDLTVTGAVDLNGATRLLTVPSGYAALNGAISSGGINKRGSGTLALGGANTYSSPTIVSNGTLIVNGTNTSSAVTSISGTKLIGAGSIGDATVNGELDPGQAASSVGTLTAASLNLRPQSSMRVTITNANGAAGAGHDTVVCSGTLTISATAGSGACTIIPDSLSRTPAGFSSASTYSWKIVDAAGLSGYDAGKFTVSTASFSPALGGGYFTVTTIGTDLYLKFLPATVANLKVTVNDTPDPVGLSNSITYAITVTNLGQSAPSPDFALTNVLDGHVTFQSSTPPAVQSGQTLSWSLTSLAGGASTTLYVVARADYYDFMTNVAHVATELADAVPDDNWATNVTEVTCVPALYPIFNPASHKSVSVNTPLSFTITAYDSGCYPPSLSVTGLPSGASFVTSNQYPSSLNAYGTVTWTPTTAGVFPIRFLASDAELNTTSIIVRVYVAGSGEPTNSAGIPTSQTNWHVTITNLVVDESAASLVWTSHVGVAYDVYSSVGQLGGNGMSWARVTNSQEATSPMSTGAFTAAESRRYFKVVLANEGLSDSNGVWAVMRPTINAGFNLVSVPVNYSSRSFSGDLGDLMASVLSGDNDGVGGAGDEVLIMDDNGSTYRTLWLDGQGPPQWHVSGGGSDSLYDGQGFFVYRSVGSTAQPTFTGPVGTPGAKTLGIGAGWNLIAPSEGWYNMTFNRVFTNLVSGTLNADWDNNEADEIIVLETSGAYSHFWYAPDGWRNLQTDALATTNTFMPGNAYYFKRIAGDLEVRF